MFSYLSKLFVFSFFLFFSFNAYSQMDMADQDAKELDVANDFDLFISKFEIWNVGNLHVYSKPENTLEADYYFKGEKIGPEFQQYLATDLKHFLNKSPGFIYALGLIRGLDEKNLYLVRNPTKRSPYQITLCRLDGEQLEPVQTLAYRKKVWNGYLQLDTWIQDVDGDTLLDLIQKGRLYLKLTLHLLKPKKLKPGFTFKKMMVLLNTQRR